MNYCSIGSNKQLKRVLFFVCFTFLSQSKSYSQTENEEYHWICEDLKYTYQIVLHQRAQIGLPITICDEIIATRKQSERTKIEFSDYITIIVFSKDEIENLSVNTKEITYEAK